MLSKGKGFGNWLRLLGRHHTHAHWTRVYDLEQGAWLDSTQAIEYNLVAPRNDETDSGRGQGGRLGGSDCGTQRQARPERRGEPGTQRESSEGHSDAERPRLGVHGLAIWDDWSRQSPKYEEGCCVAKWSSFTPDHGLTLGGLYHWAKAEGWPGPSKIPAPAEGAKYGQATLRQGLPDSRRGVVSLGADEGEGRGRRAGVAAGTPGELRRPRGREVVQTIGASAGGSS